ncbi:MAG TPA: hypothetical protein VMK13_13075 [Streptosporangiaceae bacterium]|nr:hypothetical protein [Streptosporangiaceae bacterium]
MNRPERIPAGHLGCECPCGGAHLTQQFIDRQAASGHVVVRWIAAARQARLDQYVAGLARDRAATQAANRESGR